MRWLTVLLWLPALLCTGACARPGDTESTGVEIPPYLLRLEPTRATVCWATARATRHSLHLISADGVRRVNEARATRFHRIELENLQPARSYTYRIDSWLRGEFETPAADQEFSIVAVGHTHGSETREHYADELLVGRIQELQPELVVHAGDVTYHSTEREFRKHFFSLFAPLLREVPLVLAASNHDSGWPYPRGLDFRVFRSLFPYSYGSPDGAYYEYRYRNLRFLVLSYISLARGGDPAQMAWLRERLKRPAGDFTVVVLGGANMPAVKRDELLRELAQHRVDLVLSGDGFGVRRSSDHGLPHYFTGTSGNRPHSLRWIKVRSQQMEIHRYDARGRSFGEHEVLVAKRPVTVVADLLPKALPADGMSGGKESAGVAAPATRAFRLARRLPEERADPLLIPGIGAPSPEFDALELQGRATEAERVSLRIEWRPKGSEVAYRLQSVTLRSQTQRYRLSLPARTPYGDQLYRLEEIRIFYEHGAAEHATVLIDVLALVRSKEGALEEGALADRG